MSPTSLAAYPPEVATVLQILADIELRRLSAGVLAKRESSLEHVAEYGEAQP